MIRIPARSRASLVPCHRLLQSAERARVQGNYDLRNSALMRKLQAAEDRGWSEVFPLRTSGDSECDQSSMMHVHDCDEQ